MRREVLDACPNTFRFSTMSCCPIPEKTEISIKDGVIFGAEEGVLVLTVQRRAPDSDSDSNGSGIAGAKVCCQIE